jgi:hypothetical protein
VQCTSAPVRFHYDEVAEAEAQGLPYVLVPRELSREEWEKKYCQGPPVLPGPARCGLARAGDSP